MKKTFCSGLGVFLSIALTFVLVLKFDFVSFTNAKQYSAGTVLTADTTDTEDVVIPSGYVLTMQGDITWTIQGNLVVDGTLIIDDDENKSSYPILRVQGDLNVSSSGKINADGYGYAGGAKEKNGSGTSPGIYQSNSGGGGGHAGKGGNSSKGASGGSTIYGSTLA
ncbi:hypothetical protein HYV57_00955, partial [Candidatus Peregrinibacteria bacterium]|nr:hypothetical protein [Candidatus Peregrinibacteria bacterium]